MDFDSYQKIIFTSDSKDKFVKLLGIYNPLIEDVQNGKFDLDQLKDIFTKILKVSIKIVELSQQKGILVFQNMDKTFNKGAYIAELNERIKLVNSWPHEEYVTERLMEMLEQKINYARKNLKKYE